jgi:lysophospholipase L1-like esterase
LADGLHPNDVGHQFIADCVKEKMQTVLKALK